MAHCPCFTRPLQCFGQPLASHPGTGQIHVSIINIYFIAIYIVKQFEKQKETIYMYIYNIKTNICVFGKKRFAFTSISIFSPISMVHSSIYIASFVVCIRTSSTNDLHLYQNSQNHKLYSVHLYIYIYILYIFM